jgi:hypothetical protein
MHSLKHLLVAAVFLTPAALSAQYMRSNIMPQRKGYPSPLALPDYPNQSVSLSPNEVRRVLELTRMMQTSERDAFDRIYNRMEDKRNDYLTDLRVGPDWDRPVRITPFPDTTAPSWQPHELRPSPGASRPTERHELRSLRGEHLERFRDVRSANPAARDELDRRWEEFRREILERMNATGDVNKRRMWGEMIGEPAHAAPRR